jgi:hypothetical protein
MEGREKKGCPLFLPGIDIDTRKTHGLEDRHTHVDEAE